MPVDTNGMRHWCDSIEAACTPREIMDIPSGEAPVQLPEQFLATALRYLRAACEDLDEARSPGGVKIILPAGVPLIFSVATTRIFEDESEWHSLHDVVTEQPGWDSPTKEQLMALFDRLPAPTQAIAVAWGLSDTVFRDEVHLFLQREAE